MPRPAALAATASTPERILDAAQTLTIARGWGETSMAAVAKEAGVSRQTLYNEFGTKAALASAIVMRELTAFLAGVTNGLAAHPHDPSTGIRVALESVLLRARDSELLHAAIDRPGQAENELIVLLTTQAQGVIDTAIATLETAIEPLDLHLAQADLSVGLDMIVRTMLSHVIAPGGDPAATAAGIARIANVVLGLDPDADQPREAVPTSLAAGAVTLGADPQSE